MVVYLARHVVCSNTLCYRVVVSQYNDRITSCHQISRVLVELRKSKAKRDESRRERDGLHRLCKVGLSLSSFLIATTAPKSSCVLVSRGLILQK